MNARDKKIERAQMRVLFRVPFWAIGVTKLPVEWSDALPTAATDGEKMLINPKWLDSHPEEIVPTVLCHEVAHCLLGHLWRIPAGGDFEVWNRATDHCVNLMLKEFSAQVMAKGLADPFPFPKPESAYRMDPRFSGMNEEQIYAILLAEKQAEKQQGKGGGKGGGGKGGGGKGGGGKPAAGGGQPDPHSMPVFGEMIQPNAQDAGQAQAVKTQWESAAIQSAKLAEQRGECPGNLKRLVDKLTSSEVSWYELLRSWLREQAADDWNFETPAMEYSGSGFILPSLKSDKIGAAVFATDTSGSIDSEVLAKFQAEKQSFLDDCRPSSLLDIYCDSRVQKVAHYGPGDTIDLEAPGGGGTDFSPVFSKIEKMGVHPKCLVYLTDLYGTFPEVEPDFPVLWVVWSEGTQAPWGETVRVKS
jgi:predicted metal-dependent peptidase